MSTIFEDWARGKAYIEAALEHAKGTHTIDDVALMLGAGHFRLWMGKQFAMLTEFQNFPRIKCLHVFAAGGDLSELQGMETDLLKFARDNGCGRITAAGRDGWLRALPGCKKMGLSMYRDLSSELALGAVL